MGQKIINWRPLHQRVMVVAVDRSHEQPRLWCAYIKDCPGWKHTDELQDVAAYGNKLPREIAEAIFPSMKGRPYAY